MSRLKNFSLFTVGLASALGIAWLVRQRSMEIEGLRAWRRILVERHGAPKAQQLTATIHQYYASLVAERPIPENPALRWHLKEKILPGLALYRAILPEYGGDQQLALAEVDEAFRAQTLTKSRLLLAPLNILPAPFRMFRLGFRQMMKKFPVEGWDFTYTENSDGKVAFNATRCFYLNTLSAYGAPELTASFCKTDDVMAELFPPEVRFIRPHTLGRGDALCDFQYCHVEQS